MAGVYTLNGNELTVGLQGCEVCDEAIQTAQSIADDLRQDVHLTDDDGDWLVHPRSADGTREAADPLEWRGDSLVRAEVR